jgi:hypothetical protein
MAMGKPFSMQAPEDVAKEYGGNKQSIAKAAQMGLLDPTTAVMAGMFIDRMRDAQAQEQVPQQTIAEQTFAPPQPQMPQGMPPQGMPPQGMPPQGMPQPQMTAQMPRGMGGTPQAAQMQAMQQQMAPRPSVAGMNQIPVNPNMVANAASGGLVAFAGGGEIQGYAGGGGGVFSNSQYGRSIDPETLIRERQNARAQLVNPSGGMEEQVLVDDVALNDNAFDYKDTLQKKYNAISGLLPSSDDAYLEETAYYSPEETQKRADALTEKGGKRSKEDLWTAVTLGGLSALGNNAGSTGNTFQDILRSVGTAGTAAAPGVMDAMKSKRAAEDKALGLAEASMDKRTAMKIATRNEQIALLSPALSSTDAAEKLQAENTIAVLRAQNASDIANADNANKRGISEYEAGVTMSEAEKERRAEAIEKKKDRDSQEKRTERSAAATEASSAKKQSLFVAAIIKDEENIWKRKNPGKNMPDDVRDRIERTAETSAETLKAWGALDIKAKEDRLTAAREAYEKATTEEIWALVQINETSLWAPRINAIRASKLSEQETANAIEEIKQEWQAAERKKAYENNSVPSDQNIKAAENADLLGAGAVDGGGTLR